VTERQPTLLRKAGKFLGKAVVALVIASCILVVYTELKVRWAKEQVENYCQRVVIGMPVAGLEAKAREMRLNYRRMADSNDMNGRFSVWEGFGMGRWFCGVEYQDGNVTVKKAAFLD
jgi:hypothetical protein